MVYKIAICSSDINEIEYNLKRKGFQLDEISYSINNYAIAQISAIDKENDEDEVECSIEWMCLAKPYLAEFLPE